MKKRKSTTKVHGAAAEVTMRITALVTPDELAAAELMRRRLDAPLSLSSFIRWLIRRERENALQNGKITRDEIAEEMRSNHTVAKELAARKERKALAAKARE